MYLLGTAVWHYIEHMLSVIVMKNIFKSYLVNFWICIVPNLKEKEEETTTDNLSKSV